MSSIAYILNACVRRMVTFREFLIHITVGGVIHNYRLKIDKIYQINESKLPNEF